jgi:heme A synthase
MIDTIVEQFHRFWSQLGWLSSYVSSAISYALEQSHLTYIYYLTTPILVLLGFIALLISIHQSNQAKHARLADTLIQLSENGMI